MKDIRIKPPAEYEVLMNNLTPPGEIAIFRTKQEVMTFAAALGQYKNRKESIEKYAEPIRLDIFQKRRHDSIIDLLAIADSEELEIIDTKDEMIDQKINLFQEYAAGGLAVLEEELRKPGDALSKILRLIHEAKEQPILEEDEFPDGISNMLFNS